MPPKAKFSRDEIIEAAFQIVKEEGPLALTARSLGIKLGSSARPIFTVFQSMEEVQQAVIERARNLYRDSVQKGLSKEIAFKGVGEEYILLAIKEPKIFQLLFMAEQKDVPTLSNVLPLIDDCYEEILLSIQNQYGLDDKCAEKVYHHSWIYTHGIATLCATKMCRFTQEEIQEMLTELFISLLKNIKEGASNDSSK